MERKLWNEPFDDRALLDGAALPRGGLLSIRGGRGALLFVDRGQVWLTQERDRRDVVLGAGAWYRLDRDGTAIVQARSAAVVTLTAPADAVMPEIRIPLRRTPGGTRRRSQPWLRALAALWLRMYRRPALSLARRIAASV
jgi:hypothetical protein